MDADALAVSSRIDALVPECDRQHSVDVIIRQSEWGIVPELGLGGSCYEPNIVTIVVNQESERLPISLETGEFAATLAHELHHSIRHASVGYGMTPGEVLVSEGLADRFSVEVTGNARPIWCDSSILTPDLIVQAKWQATRSEYDHSEWFFGEGVLPRWCGYAIGWHLIEKYLTLEPQQTAAQLVSVPASEILARAWGEEPNVRRTEG